MSENPFLRAARGLVLVGLLAGTSMLAAHSTNAKVHLPTADTIIHGGTVYDGSTAAPVTADVVLSGDRIVYVGPDAQKRYTAKDVVDASGMIVAPGFIDVHTHPRTYVHSKDPKQRLNAPWLFQGVSTLMIGVDGGGTPNVARKAAWFRKHHVGTNLATYVGFGPIRRKVLGMSSRAPDPEELERMKALVAKGMCEGAFGFSTGLFYAPQSYSKTDEVVALAHEAAIRGGIYDTHQRDESSYTIGLIASTKEAIAIGRKAGLPVHIAHIKALGVDVHGKAGELIQLIDAARRAGQNVTADQYPWLASGTGLGSALLPRWAVVGGRSALLDRIADAATRKRILADMRENLRRRGGSQSLLLTSSGQPWTGKTLQQMAAQWHVGAVEAALRLIRENKHVQVASFNMDEADVELLMKQPWVATSSDGNNGHPRQYATFPKKYAKYVKKAKVISLGEFIHRSTGLSAEIVGLKKRGFLRTGYFADVLVFDPDRYAPKADYVHPRVLSQGVVDLWVNGHRVMKDGALTGAAPGRFLLHTPTRGSCPGQSTPSTEPAAKT